jgi:hypothetical protein
MTSKLSKTIMFAVAVVLVMAPLVLAQQSGSSSSGMGAGTTGSADDRSGTSPSMSGSGTAGSSTTGTPSSSTGTMGAQDAIHATVDDVNHQKHTVKLRMQGGETVELKVPEQSLTSLSKGDSVQVSIHKAEGQSGMSGTQQSRPESGTGTSTGTTGSTGTLSR